MNWEMAVILLILVLFAIGMDGPIPDSIPL
jgi:hypothetical protein